MLIFLFLKTFALCDVLNKGHLPRYSTFPRHEVPGRKQDFLAFSYINAADKFHLLNPQFADIDLLRTLRCGERGAGVCAEYRTVHLRNDYAFILYRMKGESFMSEKKTSYE